MSALFIVEFRKIGYAIGPARMWSKSNYRATCQTHPMSLRILHPRMIMILQVATCRKMSPMQIVSFQTAYVPSMAFKWLSASVNRSQLIGWTWILFERIVTDKITNSQRRCMIYWWYATKIYSICGKGKRMMLPDCLVNAVRKFPEEDGKYTWYCYSCRCFVERCLPTVVAVAFERCLRWWRLLFSLRWLSMQETGTHYTSIGGE